MSERKRVMLLIESSRAYGRGCLLGVAAYVRSHGRWSVLHIERGLTENVPKFLKSWKGDGIIARIENEKIAKTVADLGVPAVDLRGSHRPVNGAMLDTDPRIVTRMAAEHFLERQLTNFAYVGSEDRGWSGRRERAYYKYLAERGFNAYIYRQPKRIQDRVWEREQTILADWIRKLPTPIGLFACDDDRGREVLEACTLASLRVPTDVAVVGVDNDEVFCDLADPPLSSVALNVETAGYRAAELLDGMMRGRIRKPRKIVVEALAVVNRRSTDMIAIDDAQIMAALQFIRRTNGRDLSVKSVVEQVSVSRRLLEKRFRESVGRSILEDIHQVRLERCKRMLVETPYPVSKIARMGGFASTGYFIQFFLKRVGTTPRRYRMDMAR